MTTPFDFATAAPAQSVRRSKAAIAPELLFLSDFGVRLIRAGFIDDDRAELVSLIEVLLDRAVGEGVFERAAWDAGRLNQEAVDALVYALDRHRLNESAIDALLKDEREAGAALYHFLAHCVLVACAIAASRGARRMTCRQLWCRHLVVAPGEPGQQTAISAAAPDWARDLQAQLGN